ncbi:MAG: UDP-N-acetylmuramoyl-L-alanine--D-glutamate ligase [Opitutaceae bacterium]|nr:UDP-N-acetylmuramoyl-L-alanine--D-glutamate ligase [Opitutaceae bacterium]
MPLHAPDLLQPLLTQPVAVFGGGVSGKAVLALLRRLGAVGTLFDEKQADARSSFGPVDAESNRLVIFSPGFRSDHPWLEEARRHGCTCMGELEFAGQFWRGAIVAITGTNGKTTLTEFLMHALRSVGREARATGNVGYSFSALVADTDGGEPQGVAVVEVSSFQAETFDRFRADAAIWTNFAEDHLERHPGMNAYFEAKWRLFDRTVGGIIVAGSSVQKYAAEFGRVLPADACVATEGQPADVLLAGTVFEHYPQRENFILAAAWWVRAGFSEMAIYEAARTFRLGRHRLQRVAEANGVTYWNDSKATNFHAVEGALGRFTAPVVLIAGGKGKGGDIASFAARIAPKVKAFVLIGETGDEMARACEQLGARHVQCASLAYAVQRASEFAHPGDHVLLSPGFASFDMFRNYEDRGAQFETLVTAFSHPAASPA